MKPLWDVVIMDVQLPGESGFDIVLSMREAGVETPVLFLTARGDVTDRVLGLSIGGDDYLVKPFAMDELKARLKVLGRRKRVPASETGPQTLVKLPRGWKLNMLQRCLAVKGREVPLAPREWSLLQIFLSHPGEVLTKTFLLERIWGIQFDPGTNVVDAMICRLRKKVDAPGDVFPLETVRGRGYRFNANV